MIPFRCLTRKILKNNSGQQPRHLARHRFLFKLPSKPTTYIPCRIENIQVEPHKIVSPTFSLSSLLFPISFHFPRKNNFSSYRCRKRTRPPPPTTSQETKRLQPPRDLPTKEITLPTKISLSLNPHLQSKLPSNSPVSASIIKIYPPSSSSSSISTTSSTTTPMKFGESNAKGR